MEHFCEEHGLKVSPLGQVIHIERTGGIEVPYQRYVEANLKIPGIAKFDEDTLMLVIKNSIYGDRFPV